MAVNAKKDFGNTRSRKPDLNTMVYGKIPPQAPQMEEAVLGAIMLEKDSLDEVMAILHTPDCFYVDANQKIYSAIIRLKTAGQPIDLLTVAEELRKVDELEICGGGFYLTNLTFNVVTAANVEGHARIIKEKFIQRELIRISGQTIGDAYEDSTDVFDLKDKLEASLSDLNQNVYSTESQHISKGVMKSSLWLEEQYARTSDITGVPTGFVDLDRITGGWQKGSLIILAARPAVGKTAFLLNLIYNAALNGIPAAIFSHEMSILQLLRRLYSMAGGIPMDYWKNPKAMPEQMRRHLHTVVMPMVSKLPIYIDDKANMTSTELVSKAKKLKKKYGVGLFADDYLQLMSGNAGQGSNREQEISKISRELKVFAKDEDVPLIALSQLNRGMEHRAVKIPQLSDLRESGAIEQDADIVGFLYAPSEDEIKQDSSLYGTTYLELAKNRDGANQPVALKFEKEFQRFKSDSPEPFRPNTGIPTRLPDSYFND